MENDMDNTVENTQDDNNAIKAMRERIKELEGVEKEYKSVQMGNAIKDAGFARSDIIKANYIITKAEYADIVFPILGDFFKGIQPAATMIVAGLIKPEMKVEIEVTALRQTNS